jgi:hypothetical protein
MPRYNLLSVVDYFLNYYQTLRTPEVKRHKR